jgi:hypothetical protein
MGGNPPSFAVSSPYFTKNRRYKPTFSGKVEVRQKSIIQSFATKKGIILVDIAIYQDRVNAIS